jgi:hypothetical protein
VIEITISRSVAGNACAAIVVDNWSRRHEAWKIKNADKLYETDSDAEDTVPGKLEAGAPEGAQ